MFQKKFPSYIAVLLVSAMYAAACGDKTPPSAKTEEASPVKQAPKAEPDAVISLNGAGATFPYPIYAKWAHMYNKVSGTELNYQSIGSGGGIAQIKAKTVDFGASDAPLKAEELETDGLIQFPMVIGGVVPVVNLEGVTPGQIKLSASVLADIFLGEIKKWNDKALAKINPDIKLPDKDIAVVHRADGSGTTWIFTNYLDKVSPKWHEKVGTGKAVDWPVGMGGKGNEGVASYVQRISGSIGYVEFAYALQNKMSHVQLQNKDGSFVDPTIESFQAAASNADWKNAPGFYMVLTDQAGAATWPITGASFILMHKEQEDKAKAEEMLKFFDFCFSHGSKQAEELHYVPMPDEVAALVRALWKDNIKSDRSPVRQ
jgi:phosphate transport system substrate-binding protein